MPTTKTYEPTGKRAEVHQSHINALKQFLNDDKYATALVFEEDVEKSPTMSMEDINRTLVEAHENKDWNMLYVGFCFANRENVRAVPLCRHAYVVDKKAARTIIRRTIPMFHHGDKMYQRLSDELMIKRTSEQLFVQDTVSSKNHHANYASPPAFRYAGRPIPENIPHVLIVGAQRAGTTYLRDMLGRQSELLAYPGEPHFFDERKYTKSTCLSVYATYLQNYTSLGHRYAQFYSRHRHILLEKTPGYISFPDRIVPCMPNDTKYIFMLRDPVERAYSYYLTGIRNGKIPRSRTFDDLLSKQWSRTDPKSVLRRGDYVHDLREWFRMVPSHNILIIHFEEMFVSRTFDWSVLQRFVGLKTPLRNIRLKPPRSSYASKMGREMYDKLQTRYRSENANLCTLLKQQGHSCPSWAAPPLPPSASSWDRDDDVASNLTTTLNELRERLRRRGANMYRDPTFRGWAPVRRAQAARVAELRAERIVNAVSNHMVDPQSTETHSVVPALTSTSSTSFVIVTNYEGPRGQVWMNSTRPAFEEYARTYGYEFRAWEGFWVRPSDGRRFEGDSRHPKWTKLSTLEQVLEEEGNGWVMWMDADILLRDVGLRLEHIVAHVTKDVILTRRIDVTSSTVLVRRSPGGRAFVKAWRAHSSESREHEKRFVDQGVLIDMLFEPGNSVLRSKWRDVVELRDCLCTDLYLRCSDRFCEALYPSHVDLWDRPEFATHAAGCPNKRECSKGLLRLFHETKSSNRKNRSRPVQRIDSQRKKYRPNETIHVLCVTRDEVGANRCKHEFRRQTYPRKVLILLMNEGPYDVACDDLHESDCEIRYGGEDATLGELREMAQRMVPVGSVWVQFDDDDVRHPNLLAAQYAELTRPPASHAVTLSSQLLFDVERNASVHVLKTARASRSSFWHGIAGTIMVRRTAFAPSYPSLRRHEDTHFFRSMLYTHDVRVLINPSYYYVRVSHGGAHASGRHGHGSLRGLLNGVKDNVWRGTTSEDDATRDALDLAARVHGYADPSSKTHRDDRRLSRSNAEPPRDQRPGTKQSSRAPRRVPPRVAKRRKHREPSQPTQHSELEQTVSKKESNVAQTNMATQEKTETHSDATTGNGFSAAIIYLVEESRLYGVKGIRNQVPFSDIPLTSTRCSRENIGFLHSLTTLYNNFLRDHMEYPIILFHEADFDKMDVVRDHVMSLNASIDLRFARVDLDDKTSARFVAQSSCAKHTERVRGRNYMGMCAWFSRDIMHHSALRSFDYYMRLDTDSCFNGKIHVDFFRFAYEHGATYLYRDFFLETTECFLNWQEPVHRHVCSNNVDATKLSEHAGVPFGRCDDGGSAPGPLPKRLQVFSTNFEIVRIASFREPAVVRFLDAMHEVGGYWTHRWGDAPIRTITALLFMPSTFRRVPMDWTYFHKVREYSAEHAWTVVLSGTITPHNDVDHLVQTNPASRTEAYRRSLSHWVRNTNAPIIFVDNSPSSRVGDHDDTTFSSFRPRVHVMSAPASRVGHNKGRGERDSVMAALSHVKTPFVLKVTGRYAPKDIQTALSRCDQDTTEVVIQSSRASPIPGRPMETQLFGWRRGGPVEAWYKAWDGRRMIERRLHSFIQENLDRSQICVLPLLPLSEPVQAGGHRGVVVAL